MTKIFFTKEKVFICFILAFFILGLVHCGGSMLPQSNDEYGITGKPEYVEYLPEFPWPPPKPSRQRVIPLPNSLKTDLDEVLIRHVDEKIRIALGHSEYDFGGYYSVPGGYAYATAIEKINEDGSPNYEERWSFLQPDFFEIKKVFLSGFPAKRGLYRMFVFVVSKNLFATSKKPIFLDDLPTGLNGLPPQIGNQSYTDNHKITVLIYEFLVPPKKNIAHPWKTPLSLRRHITKAGLWESLELNVAIH